MGVHMWVCRGGCVTRVKGSEEIESEMGLQNEGKMREGEREKRG